MDDLYEPSNLLPFPGAPAPEGAATRPLVGAADGEGAYEKSSVARSAYLRLRSEGRLDHSRAMAALAFAVGQGRLKEPEDAEEGADDGEGEAADAQGSDSGGSVERGTSEAGLKAQATQEGWQQAYEASRAESLLEAVDGGLGAQERLKVLAAQQRAAKMLLDQALGVLEGPPPHCGCEACNGGYDKYEHGEWPNAGVQGVWRAARRDWAEVSAQVAEAAEEVRRRGLESGSGGDPYWQQEYERTLGELLGEYLDGGPQYGILCRGLASLDTRIRQMERSGRDITSDEYARMAKARLEAVNQLQRYTESTKAESYSGVQTAVLKLSTELEKEFKAQSPQVWERIVKTIAHAVRTEGLGMEMGA